MGRLWKSIKAHPWVASTIGVLTLATNLLDAWDLVLFVTTRGRWAWLPETSTIAAIFRVVAILAALLLIWVGFRESSRARTRNADPEAPDPFTSGSSARATIAWTNPDPSNKDGWAVVAAGVRRYGRTAVRINLAVPPSLRTPLFLYIDVHDPDGRISRTSGKRVSLYPDDFTSADDHLPLVLEPLAPGIYRVRVRAKSHEASSSEAVASTAFEVLPHGAVNPAIIP